MRHLVLAASLASALGAFGCSSDASDSNSGNETPTGTAVKDLTPQEVKALCVKHEDTFGTLSTTACTGQAWIVSGGDVTACEMTRDECLADPGISGAGCANAESTDVSGCPLSVGEVEQCLNEVLNYAPNVSCSAATTPDPPACVQTLLDECFPDMMATGS